MIFREHCLVFFLFMLCNLTVMIDSLRTRIVKTAVVNFAPSIKQHHVFVIEQYNRILYTVDFSPLDQSNPRTLVDLVLGQDVPSEVRVKFISGVDFYDDDGIVEQWLSRPCVSHGSSLLPILRTWQNSTMNLYTHNCQHFSAFMSSYNNNIK